jgi:cytochrome c oxidase subunit 3
MAATTHTLDLSAVPPPLPKRQRVVLLGAALAVAGAVVLFATLLAVYVSQRAGAGGSWFGDQVSIPLSPPNMELTTLLMSSVVIQWALYAVRNDDRPNTYVALALTVVLGGAFIVSEAYLYSQMGLTIDTVAGLLVYTITGAHIAMLVLAMLFVLLTVFRALGGQFGPSDRDGIAAAALTWHATVLLFVPIWFIIYIQK